MSFNQLLPEDTPGVVADSFFAADKLQHMSRRHIMSQNVKVAEIVGLASGSLFGPVSIDIVVQNQEKNISTTLLLYLEDWYCSIIEFPEHYYSFCGNSDFPIGVTA